MKHLLGVLKEDLGKQIYMQNKKIVSMSQLQRVNEKILHY